MKIVLQGLYTKYFYFFIVALFLLILGFLFKNNKQQVDINSRAISKQSQQKKWQAEIMENKIVVSIANIDVVSYVACTSDETARGLSVFDSLGEYESMLFIFETEDFHPFWMKDMNFSIDIIWLNEFKEVVFMKEHSHPNDYPESYTPDKKSLYVVEFNEGFVEKNDIQLGDVFMWD